MRPPAVVNIAATKAHTGTVIFLHGSGDTGAGIKNWVQGLLGKDLTFPHLKIIYPSAPARPYTALDGEFSNIWFDRGKISIDAKEDLETLNSSVVQISELVKREVQSGIPMKNIIIGGFSMGGALSLHIGLRALTDVGGIFTLSSFLSHTSEVYQELRKKHSSTWPPLFMCHGDRDNLVPLSWGEKLFANLREHGVNGQFHVLPGTAHELTESWLMMLQDWINKTIPLEK